MKQTNVGDMTTFENERPAPRMVREGQEFIEALMDAQLQKAFGGIGGCKEFNLEAFPARFHDLLIAYLNEDLMSVEATYIAMQRVAKVSS